MVVVITLSILEERCEFFGGKPDLRTGPAEKMRICVLLWACAECACGKECTTSHYGHDGMHGDSTDRKE